MKLASSIKAMGSTAEIMIYEEIGEGFFGGLGAKAFREQIGSLPATVTTLNVRINSDGGSVFDGVAIYNTLKEHPAKKNVIIDGIAASIATVIAMAGDTITIQPTATMMIHNARATVRGESSGLRSMADLLDQINGQMAIAYARSGLSNKEILGIMAAETWYTAQGAVDAGWCDSIVAEPMRMAASIKDFDLSRFEHVPDYVLKMQAAADADCTCPCGPCVGGDCDGCTDEDCDCAGCDCDSADASAKSKKKAAATASASQLQAAEIAASVRSRQLRLAQHG